MRVMGIEAIYQKPNTSLAHPAHKVYPYLLRGLLIDRPNQVWCADITYVPMAKGFVPHRSRERTHLCSPTVTQRARTGLWSMGQVT
jgi:transposase InsO family protein